jgi:glycosyltransferase involved in cell wall biosynthesis
MSTLPTVVHVLEAMGGGTSRHLLDLVTSTDGFTHVVVVPTQRFEDATDTTMIPGLRAAGFDVRIIDMRRTPTHPDNAKAMLKIWWLLQSLKPSIVHGHSHIGGALARAGSFPVHGVPRVWTPNGVHTKTSVLLAERAFNLLTSATVAVSESEAELLRSRRVVRPGRLVTIPNGIETTPRRTDPGRLRRDLGIPQDAPLVGTIGRLMPQKAPLDFVACCALLHERYPSAHFVQIGDGVMAADVDEAARDLTAKGVYHRVAYLPNASEYLSDLDVFLLQSVFEGGPYAPLEAMREGVPVVLTDVVGSRDVVIDGVSGFLVRYADVGAAAEAVGKLLDNPSLRATFSVEGTKRLNDMFSARAMGEAHRAMYQSLLRHRKVSA